MTFIERIKQLREQCQLPQRKVGEALEIDMPMYSKIERGDRPAKREQVVKLAGLFHIAPKELLTLWLADKIKEYQEINKISNRTATYELKELFEQFGILKMSGAGAATFYKLQ
jgi:transcriptional regulator with XRE-family HTH domain